MSEKINCFENAEWLKRLSNARSGLSNTLYAMYSGLTGGITVDPALMTIPADDHLPQRGDGVFESLKCLNGQLYNANAHLERLEFSCKGIGMQPPCPRGDRGPPHPARPRTAPSPSSFPMTAAWTPAPPAPCVRSPSAP